MSKGVNKIQIRSQGGEKMLTEERHSVILDMLNKQHSVHLSELCKILNTSESTIRRDLTALAEKNLLVKVHGGAIAVGDTFSPVEYNMTEKSQLNNEEKTAIAKYAASLIEDGDFIYIDAGTSTEKMVDFLPDKKATFVTNGIVHAKKIAQMGFKVFILGGEFKPSTEAVVGTDCVLALQKYNFTKCFLGVNGISVSAGLSTHDQNEASVKTAAMKKSKRVYILADHSKFDQITAMTFSTLENVKIITDKLEDKKYFEKANIKEVL